MRALEAFESGDERAFCEELRDVLPLVLRMPHVTRSAASYSGWWQGPVRQAVTMRWNYAPPRAATVTSYKPGSARSPSNLISLA